MEIKRPWVLLFLGWAALFGPTYHSLATTVWATDEQGHGPIIFAVSAWLLWQRRHALAALEGAQKGKLAGWIVFLAGWLLFMLGRSQYIGVAESAAQLPILAGLVLISKGWRGLNVVKFPLFFMLFMIPLPPDFVGAVTGPLKSAVSAVAAQILYVCGYPVARAGVILTVGQYQLLVADACAGLNSMFTLEALGLLYMNLMKRVGFFRNAALAVLILPISFVANVARVLILVLVTYYFGDAAGQGFMHGFAGMVLFMVALVLILFVDKLLDLAFRRFGAQS